MAAKGVWSNKNYNKIWDCCSSRTGPHLVILGGVHGNEIVGVEVIKWLVDVWGSFTKEALSETMRGRLTLAIGNPEAVEKRKRATTPANDLNRLFRPVYLEQSLSSEKKGTGTTNNSYERRRSYELAPFLRSCDILLDIHATNKPSPPFVRVGGEANPRHFDFVRRYLHNPKCMLLDPDYTIGLGEASTTDEFVGLNGGLGLCYETGIADDLGPLNDVKLEICRLLKGELGVSLPASSVSDDPPSNVAVGVGVDEVYEMVEAVMYQEGFEFSAGYGTANFQHLPASTALDKKSKFKRPRDLYLVFPKVQELFVVDKPVVWLTRKRELSKVNEIIATQNTQNLHQFRDMEIERRCFTHKSFGPSNYEQYELIGDRVLKLVQMKKLFAEDPTASEGTLTHQIAAMENNSHFARISERLGLIDRLQASKSVLKYIRDCDTTRKNKSADLFEAFIGAIYVDMGMQSEALDKISELYSKLQQHSTEELQRLYPNPIGLLQEEMRKRDLDVPKYDIVQLGNQHKQFFRCDCKTQLGTTSAGGRNKKAAKEAAATRAIEMFLK